VEIRRTLGEKLSSQYASVSSTVVIKGGGTVTQNAAAL